MKEKIPQVERALAGRFGPHQRFLGARQRAHLDFLDRAIAEVSAEGATRLAPFEEEIALLAGIPGVGRGTAEELIAESGVDMGQFPSPAQLASWAGLAPGQHKSAGQRTSGKTRKGRARAGCGRPWSPPAMRPGAPKTPPWGHAIGRWSPGGARNAPRWRLATRSS
jgi:transposase